MSEFRWNSGGSFNGKPWDENLPTDAMVTILSLQGFQQISLNFCII